MNKERMLIMANQIAGFFHSFPHEEGVEGVANHIRLFWDPHMRRKLLAYVDTGGEGLDPMVLEAIPKLRSMSPA